MPTALLVDSAATEVETDWSGRPARASLVAARKDADNRPIEDGGMATGETPKVVRVSRRGASGKRIQEVLDPAALPGSSLVDAIAAMPEATTTAGLPPAVVAPARHEVNAFTHATDPVAATKTPRKMTKVDFAFDSGIELEGWFDAVVVEGSGVMLVRAIADDGHGRVKLPTNPAIVFTATVAGAAPMAVRSVPMRFSRDGEAYTFLMIVPPSES